MTRRPRYVEWRVYAGDSERAGMFVYARIFNTRREMLQVCRAERRASGDVARYPPAVQGVMQSFTQYVNGRVTPCFGRVNLYRGALDVETVVHEFGHAALAWAWRRRLIAGLAGMPVEERVCYALGRMVRRFVTRAHRYGLYGEE